MAVFSERERASIAADLVTQLLHDTATVSARTEVRDTGGGFTTTWATRWTGPGRVAPSSATEAELAHRMNHDVSVAIALPDTATVAPDDRIAIGGRTYEVLSVPAERTWDVLTRVLAVEVQ